MSYSIPLMVLIIEYHFVSQISFRAKLLQRPNLSFSYFLLISSFVQYTCRPYLDTDRLTRKFNFTIGFTVQDYLQFGLLFVFHSQHRDYHISGTLNYGKQSRPQLLALSLWWHSLVLVLSYRSRFPLEADLHPTSVDTWSPSCVVFAHLSDKL